jgi:hypothetical protein
MIAIANRYYKLAVAYGGYEIWEEFVLRNMHEQRGIESPSIAETASLFLGRNRSGIISHAMKIRNLASDTSLINDCYCVLILQIGAVAYGGCEIWEQPVGFHTVH